MESQEKNNMKKNIDMNENEIGGKTETIDINRKLNVKQESKIEKSKTVDESVEIKKFSKEQSNEKTDKKEVEQDVKPKKVTYEEKTAKETSKKQTLEEKRAKEAKVNKSEGNKKSSQGKQPSNIDEPKWKVILKDVRTYFMLLLFLPMLYLLYEVISFNVLPMKYLIPAILVLLLISAGLVWLQYSKKVNKINNILGKAMIVILSILMCVGCVYLGQANTAIDEVTVKEGDTEYEVISVVVKKESKAEELKDLKDGVFAIPEKMDEENTKATIEDINTQLNKTITTAPYGNTNEQAGALMDDKVDAMILNEAYRSLLEENYPKFDAETKIIYTFKIAKEVKKIGEGVDVLTNPYNVYISGIDTYGPIATNSRSDVNMIATINPKTKQIMLTSVPRDFYVAQTCQGNQKDKLTHTGIFGVGCTVESMQNFTGLTFNYYVRVNFSSLEAIVDAIGGIDIYNQFGFYSGVDGTLIPGGDIHVNGNTALKFARERHAYADGDRQRGRNQMIVLEGIISKATSPAIITGYSGIMNAVGSSFQTNMTKDEMTSIIKDQLDNGGSWSIQQQSVTGGGGTDWTPANGFNAYVMYPDTDSVNTALANIKTIMDGGNITLE